MKSILKKLDMDSIIEMINDIEDPSAIIEESIGPITITKFNKAVINDDEKFKADNRLNLIVCITMQMSLEMRVFESLRQNKTNIEHYLEHYSHIYKPSISMQKQNEYIDKILGKDSKKGIINVYIRDGSNFRPILCFVNYRNDFDLDTHKKYSEEEILRLIESKEIVVLNNPLYKETKDHFFCGLEECVDIEDKNVVKFVLKHYPFIYEELRRNIDFSKLESDRVEYLRDRKEGLNKIANYYRVMKEEIAKKAEQCRVIEQLCNEGIKRLP